MVKSEGVILVSAPRRRRGCAIPQTQFPTNYANFPSPSTALRRSPHPDLQSGLSSALVGGQCDTRRREKQQFTRPPDFHAKTPAPKCDSNYDSNSSYFIWSPSCSWGPKSPDRQTDRRTDGQPCRQFLLSWLQNLYYFKQFVIVLPALRRKMTSLAKSFTSLQPSDFIYLAAILWIIL